MSIDRLRANLERMRQAANDANSFVKNVDREAFRTDIILHRAVGMSLLMAAEAATQIMAKFPEFAAEHAEIPWTEIRGMRNRIAHGYFEIDLDMVWEVAMKEAAELVSQIDVVLSWRAQGE